MHLARKKAELKDMGILHRLTDCRLTDNELTSVCLMWASCDATASYVSSLRASALAPVTLLPADMKAKYKRIIMRRQTPDQGMPVPDWGKSLAKHRQYMRATALHMVTPDFDKWFSFTYARQQPHTTSFTEMVLLPQELASRVSSGVEAEGRELATHAFVWESKFLYKRDIDLHHVATNQISVVPFVTFAEGGRCFSDFVEMSLSEWFQQMPVPAPDKNEVDAVDELPQWFSPYDFIKQPWMVEHLEQKVQESSDDEHEPGEHVPAPLPDDVEDRVDEMFKYIMDKEVEHVVALEQQVLDFVTILRVRKREYLTGEIETPIRFARGIPSSPDANIFVEERGGFKTFDASWEKYGEWEAIAMCQFWCYKMQFLFDRHRGFDTSSFLDEGGNLKDPEMLEELKLKLADDAPHWLRILQVRMLD